MFNGPGVPSFQESGDSALEDLQFARPGGRFAPSTPSPPKTQISVATIGRRHGLQILHNGNHSKGIAVSIIISFINESTSLADSAHPRSSDRYMLLWRTPPEKGKCKQKRQFSSSVYAFYTRRILSSHSPSLQASQVSKAFTLSKYGFLFFRDVTPFRIMKGLCSGLVSSMRHDPLNSSSIKYMRSCPSLLPGRSSAHLFSRPPVQKTSIGNSSKSKVHSPVRSELTAWGCESSC